MGTWNTRGLRGSALESLINRTNEQYARRGLALIQKVPTPITPVKIDKEHRHITLAYFEQKSTVDYIGAVQGVPVCFDVYILIFLSMVAQIGAFVFLTPETSLVLPFELFHFHR